MDDLRRAAQAALDALEAIDAELTVGDRFTNAGQYLLDALPLLRAALAQPEQQAEKTCQQCSDEGVRRGAEAERERQGARVARHMSLSTMSVYGTQPECKAARDALQRLLDDME